MRRNALLRSLGQVMWQQQHTVRASPQQALDAAPNDSKSRWRIPLRNGHYYEKIDVDPQAVALMTARGSDRAHFGDVTIDGHQDTVLVDDGRSCFKNCAISGSVDFIFGAGQTVFEACDIVSRPRTKTNLSLLGYVTAPSTQIRDPYGLVFVRCTLLKESTLVPANSTAFGRPWHAAANMPDGRYADPNAIGSSVFIDCFMDDHITGDGWFSMTGLQKSGSVRTVFLPEDSRFFEYKSTGPGANINSKRRQLTDAQAAEYTVANVLGDWRP